jgi:hypothetical protein
MKLENTLIALENSQQVEMNLQKERTLTIFLSSKIMSVKLEHGEGSFS